MQYDVLAHKSMSWIVYIKKEVKKGQKKKKERERYVVYLRKLRSI